jgi:NADH-quinone oxidoreductase subunit A
VGALSVDSPGGYGTPLWPLAVYFLLVVMASAGMLVVSYLLGGRHREPATDIPYESGMMPTGTGRLSFPADFYLVAVFFVVFDVESVFLYAWAVALRQAGWFGFAEALIFIGVLLAALVYLWRVGGLDWASLGRRGRARVIGRDRP